MKLRHVFEVLHAVELDQEDFSIYEDYRKVEAHALAT